MRMAVIPTNIQISIRKGGLRNSKEDPRISLMRNKELRKEVRVKINLKVISLMMDLILNNMARKIQTMNIKLTRIIHLKKSKL